MKFLLKSSLLIFSLFIYSCSKDSPLPLPTPTVTYALSVSASEGGTVNNTGGTYNENSNVSITANADAGYEFTSWSGDASGTDNPLTVSMNSNKTITANFIRTQYTLSVGKIGEGTITKEVISSDKTSEEYNSGDVVRLNATPSSGSIFNSWSGSSTETTNQIDVTIDGTKSVTATFEETISQVLGSNDTFLGVGKWKIRKRTSGTDTSKSAECELSEIIFRNDGSFTVFTDNFILTGVYNVDSNTTITLTSRDLLYGSLTNIVLTNNLIFFSININDICSDENLVGERDKYYDEATDTSLPPVISLIGSPTIVLEVGDTFTDPGANASDNVDGDITSSITTSGTVDTATEGTYIITYTVSDAAGISSSITRTVVVRLDLPPTITLIGSSTITLQVGDTFTDPGATAVDEVDGDLTSSITTSGSVNTSIAGDYSVEYSVMDSGYNTSSVTRTIIVNTPPDTSAPTISLIGASTINLNVGDNFTDPGASASDNVDGNITSSVTTSGNIDTATEGTYIITYTVSDAAGNSSSITRTVVVRLDLPPTITLTGSSTITLLLGDTFTDPGATAVDEVDGDLTSSIITTGTVDTSTVGVYTLTYTVSDAAGNLASVIRNIVINSGFITFDINIIRQGTGSNANARVISGSDRTGNKSGIVSGQNSGSGLLIYFGDTIIFDRTLEDGSYGSEPYINTYSASGGNGNTENTNNAQVQTQIDSYRKSFKPNSPGTYYLWFNGYPAAEVIITVQ